ncbi:ABC transporter substrate-binding protein [Anaerocolumna sp. AGMB13025]|uniref:ABC transporter substrate-binding protein n=1 Tax=Anaerocolumna sp. AGMB13025 TaxID=3039116 RepID=UPI00241DFEDE|nr:ABC transporter substrate-binding protein [Anaerocolumna sp. AGMB13025]WFR59501.1 ABC transporter substrate-binding protein [Anaerocolumna sp. AGMB13025]
MKKKLMSCLLVTALVIGTLTACGKSGTSTPNTPTESTDSSTQSESGNTPAANTEKKKIVFWYSHTGDEATSFEKAIKAYNESQDKYVVEGLSVTDKQKVIVAISGNEAPDVIEASNQDVITYATSGLIEPVSDMASSDNYSMEEQFAGQSLIANTLEDKVYGVPFAAMIIQMFYNKDILKEIGYTQPPTTMEELYDMAVKATQVDENGTITRLGYPLFPLASARQELIYAFGGRWWAEDGKTLTPDNPGILDSLNMNLEYRSKYGIEKVQEFVATANTNRYTENDMFFAGKQLFRFDGPWLAAMIKNNNSDVNYGVALIPGTKAQPELQGTSRYETNSLTIPVVANEKEGAWDFIKYFTNSDATKELLIDIANLPTQLSLYDDPDILAQPNFDVFVAALKTENGIQYPKIEDLSKYTSLIEEHLDYAYNGMETPEKVLKELKKQSDLLK